MSDPFHLLSFEAPSDQASETDSVLPDGTPPPHSNLESFARTASDIDGKLLFVPSTSILKEDGTPQDLLFVGHGTIKGKQRDCFALSWVSVTVGGARTQYYYSGAQGKHRFTGYDKIQKWLPGLWKAQVTNDRVNEQKTRALRILSLFHNKESFEVAMSTVFDPDNRVTEQEMMGAKYDDDEAVCERRGKAFDDGDFDSLFDGSEAESDGDESAAALHESSLFDHDSPEVVSESSHAF
jgi:hypothetical protein